MENIKQFSTEKANLLFVEVPKDAIKGVKWIDKAFSVDVTKSGSKLSWYHYFFDGVGRNSITLPPGSWTLAGSIGEVTESVCNILVEGFGVNGYLDYRNNMPFHEYLLKTAKESLQSLCASLNLLETNAQLLYELKN